MGSITKKARDAVCPSCEGRGGKHTRLDCGAMRDELARLVPRGPRKGRKDYRHGTTTLVLKGEGLLEFVLAALTKGV